MLVTTTSGRRYRAGHSANGRSHQSGTTILEVMVAVVVFSIGLLGVGALLTSAIRGNNSAHKRTVAQTLAASMESRMSRNSIATWAGTYNGTYGGSAGSSECDTIACNPTQLAIADAILWGQQLADALPNGTGTITCVDAAVLPAGSDGYPPYRGRCLMDISWSEAGDVGSAAPESIQTFSYVAQP